MCWVCDHPKASRQDWLDHLREALAEECWIVISVQREKYRPPYSYTVGLTDHGKPEIVVTGLSQQRAADVLNGVAAHFVHADPPPPGERVPVDERAADRDGPRGRARGAPERRRRAVRAGAHRAAAGLRRRPRPLAVGPRFPGRPRWAAGPRSTRGKPRELGSAHGAGAPSHPAGRAADRRPGPAPHRTTATRSAHGGPPAHDAPARPGQRRGAERRPRRVVPARPGLPAQAPAGGGGGP